MASSWDRPSIDGDQGVLWSLVRPSALYHTFARVSRVVTTSSCSHKDSYLVLETPCCMGRKSLLNNAYANDLSDTILRLAPSLNGSTRSEHSHLVSLYLAPQSEVSFGHSSLENSSTRLDLLGVIVYLLSSPCPFLRHLASLSRSEESTGVMAAAIIKLETEHCSSSIISEESSRISFWYSARPCFSSLLAC